MIYWFADIMAYAIVLNTWGKTLIPINNQAKNKSILITFGQVQKMAPSSFSVHKLRKMAIYCAKCD